MNIFNSFSESSPFPESSQPKMKGPDLTMIPGGSAFDENKIDFNLNGGPKYTDVLVASAMFNDGDSKGFACPLVCKWFYTIKNNQLKEIEGVCGSFYQPSLDDIGAKICVHAHPTNGIDEYQGMPMFAEVGPLTMDDGIFKKAQEYIEMNENDRNFSIRIKQSNIGALKDKSLPYNCSFITTDMMVVFNSTVEKQQFFMVPFSKKFPKLRILRNANNLIEMKVNEEEYLILEIEPNLRDILTLVIRTLLARCPVASFPHDSQMECEVIASETEEVSKKEEDLKSTKPHIKPECKTNLEISTDQSENNQKEIITEVVEEVINEAINTSKDFSQKENSNPLKEDQKELQDNTQKEIKPILKRQKLTTGKKKPKKKDENKNIEATVNNNPFKEFVQNSNQEHNLSMNTNSKEQLPEEQNVALSSNEKKTGNALKIETTEFDSTSKIFQKETQTETEEDDHESDYLGGMMKISQLSQELTQKNDYLEKSENIILQLKKEVKTQKEELSNHNSIVSTLKEEIITLKADRDDLNSQMAEYKNNNSFLELENKMLSEQKAKIESICPDFDLNNISIVKKEEYLILKNICKDYIQLSKVQKSHELKHMMRNDPSIIGKRNKKAQESKLEERKQQEDKCKLLEEKYEEVVMERNQLRNFKISQCKDFEKMRKKIAYLQKLNEKQRMLNKSTNKKSSDIISRNNSDSDLDFDPTSTLPNIALSEEGDPNYDLRIGESMMTSPSDDQIQINHSLRAELEDYRLKLEQSDQILEEYKQVLLDEVRKKNDLKKELKHLKLLQEYGYDEEELSLGQLRMKMDDMKILLQEKNLQLAAQKDVNKQLIEKLNEKASQ
ncbi:unnamed protein product [Moneuplotes crassus]|uniref:Uncharacterized protein n=1 Tax=Euplotes crassus TaxID=5936 RepID=A0AAD2DAF2_EUPCR|nr:unnamed protein product [Moneuplotes crassus]